MSDRHDQKPTARRIGWKRSLIAVLRSLFISIGVIGTILIILAFTRIPFDVHRALAAPGAVCEEESDLIVILGGSGMPSGPELLRLHYGAMRAMQDPNAHVVVVHPIDTAVMQAMVDELILKGVAADRIGRSYLGTNTREQALHVAETFPDHGAKLSIVTAPENMYRTLRTFKTAGFAHVCGVPAFDHAMFVDLRYDHRKIGGKKAIPDISGELDLRYTFWNYLKLEITCLREFAAIAYYEMNGWI